MYIGYIVCLMVVHAIPPSAETRTITHFNSSYHRKTLDQYPLVLPSAPSSTPAGEFSSSIDLYSSSLQEDAKGTSNASNSSRSHLKVKKNKYKNRRIQHRPKGDNKNNKKIKQKKKTKRRHTKKSKKRAKERKLKNQNQSVLLSKKNKSSKKVNRKRFDQRKRRYFELPKKSKWTDGKKESKSMNNESTNTKIDQNINLSSKEIETVASHRFLLPVTLITSKELSQLPINPRIRVTISIMEDITNDNGTFNSLPHFNDLNIKKRKLSYVWSTKVNKANRQNESTIKHQIQRTKNDIKYDEIDNKYNEFYNQTQFNEEAINNRKPKDKSSRKVVNKLQPFSKSSFIKNKNSLKVHDGTNRNRFATNILPNSTISRYSNPLQKLSKNIEEKIHFGSGRKKVSTKNLVETLVRGLESLVKRANNIGSSDPCETWQTSNIENYLQSKASLQSLPSCLCSYPDDLVYNDSIYDKLQKKYFRWRQIASNKEFLDVLHKGAHLCIRSVTLEHKTSLSAQICCYDQSRTLITRGQSAGFPSMVSYEVSPGLHKLLDVTPWKACNGNFMRFHAFRPPNNRLNCQENPKKHQFKIEMREATDY